MLPSLSVLFAALKEISSSTSTLVAFALIAATGAVFVI